MASKSTIKALSNLALVYGLTSHIKDNYKANKVVNTCDKVLTETHKAMDLWPGQLTEKQYQKIYNKILKLHKDLDMKDSLIYVACAAKICNDMCNKIRYEKKRCLEYIEELLNRLLEYMDRGGKNNYQKYEFSEQVLVFWEV